MDGLINFFTSVWKDYIRTDEGLATLLIILAIILKLFINRRVTKRHFKRMIVSIPSEITFLVIGFLLSTSIREGYTKDFRDNMALIVMTLIILIIQYALERYLDNKLSGNIGIRRWICVALMYAMSIILYYIVVFGGNY